MKPCFGYVRVSTQKQGEGVSLEAQREAIERFAAQHQLTVSEWFEEKETAAKSGRPVFNRMIRELHHRKAEGLIMHKIDRSARNFADWARIGELSDAGVDVHFATETLDFRSRGGRLSADIQAVIAADYIRNLREETIKGITGRLKQGLYPFKAPIGYLDNGGGKPKTIDPVRGPLVRQAFELYDSGQHSIRSLVETMKSLGLRNDSGRPVTKCGIETILQNPFYWGMMRLKHSGAIYQGVHEPLIPLSLFEAVQDRKAGRAVKKRTRHAFIYRGLFRCGHCKMAMIAERQKGHVYYRCHTLACPTKCVREEALEAAVRSTLLETRLGDVDLAWLQDQISAWIATRDDRAAHDTVVMQLANIEARVERLTDALIDRLIDREEFEKRNGILLLEKSRLEEQRRHIAARSGSPKHVVKFIELTKNLVLLHDFAEPGEKRTIAEIATSNRTVSRRSIGMEPANWLSRTQIAVAVLSGAPLRTTSRTRTKLQDQQMQELAELAADDSIGRKLAKLVGAHDSQSRAAANLHAV